jgi:predicted  nucleic acid-binding Zn-ribbon protein
MMLEAFPSRQEFMALLEEIRALREDSNRRFEAMDRRYEELQADVNQHFEELRTDVNQQFAAQGQQMRDLNVHMSSLGGRVEHRLKQMVKEIVEEFAG